MATYGELKSFQFTASSDCSTLKYHFGKTAGAGLINLATAPSSSSVFGVFQNAPRINEQATVGYDGLSKVVAGAAISANAYITHTTSGRATTVVSGSMCCGVVLEASAADGDIVAALLFPPFRWSGAA